MRPGRLLRSDVGNAHALAMVIFSRRPRRIQKSMLQVLYWLVQNAFRQLRHVDVNIPPSQMSSISPQEVRQVAVSQAHW